MREDFPMSQLKIVAVSILFLSLTLMAGPQSQPTGQSSPQQKGMMMLTIFLKHDQSKTLDEINQHLKQTGVYGNVSARRRGGGFLVRDDGNRPGGDSSFSSGEAARRKSCH
jgi:hypothetical protein